MAAVQIIEAFASLLWCYAGLTLVHWAFRLSRLDRRQHIPTVAELLSHLVPAMIALVLTVLIGSFVGLPSVVVLIALLFPAGLAYGGHSALHDLDPPPSRKQTLVRFALAIALAALVVAVRQSQ